jgi:hypothetical protein
MSMTKVVAIAFGAFVLGVVFGTSRSNPAPNPSTTTLPPPAGSSSDTAPIPSSETIDMEVVSHHWKIQEEDNNDMPQWGWVAKIKNNGEKRCDIHVSYTLVDKDGMKVGESNDGTNIAPNETLDISASNYLEKRLFSAVKGSRVEVSNHCTFKSRSTPVQWLKKK